MKHNNRIFISVLSAVMACGLFATDSAFAQDNDEFTKLMMQGVRQFKEGQNDPAQYEAAIESFKAARQINPNPDATYNIARAYHKLGKCDEALASYREYAATSAENAESVKEYIQTLSKECGNTKGTLMLRCSPENTRVSIDNQPSGSCLPEQVVAVGTHYLTFAADGYKTETRTVTVVADSRKATPIVVELTPNAQTTNSQKTTRSGRNDNQQETYNYGAPQYDIDNNAQNNNYQNYGNTDINTNRADYDSSRYSDFESVDQQQTQQIVVDNPDKGEFTKLFWAGVGLTGGGTLFTMIGAIALGKAYKYNEYFINKGEYLEFYEKNKAAVGAGGTFLGLGMAAIVAGVTCFVLDKVFLRRDAEAAASETALSFEPVLNFGVDSASAGIAVTF